MSEIISLANLKGGVGKTVSSINIAYSLAKLGKKVLIIDTDSQGHISASLGMASDSLKFTLFDLINDVIDNNFTDEKVEQCIRTSGAVDIIPSNSKLATIECKLMDTEGRELVLRKITDAVKEYYDYIIIDCPPSLGIFVINALTTSDYVLIPVEAQYLCFERLDSMIDTVKMVKNSFNESLNIAGIFLTKFQSNTKICNGIRNEILKVYDGSVRVFDECIPYSIKAAEQPLLGKSLVELMPKHQISVAYMKIAKELLNYGK